jgi:hypothetical protein
MKVICALMLALAICGCAPITRPQHNGKKIASIEENMTSVTIRFDDGTGMYLWSEKVIWTSDLNKE